MCNICTICQTKLNILNVLYFMMNFIYELKFLGENKLRNGIVILEYIHRHLIFTCIQHLGVDLTRLIFPGADLTRVLFPWGGGGGGRLDKDTFFWGPI